MDFSYSEDQQSVAALARQIFCDKVSDGAAAPELWATLAEAGLLGVALEEDCGGAGFGLLGAGLMLKEMGAVLAPLPLLPAIAAALAQAEGGDRDSAARFVGGDCYSVASADAGLVLSDGRVSGELATVPFAGEAESLVAIAGDQLVQVVLAQDSVTLEAQLTSNLLPAAHVTLVNSEVRTLGDSAACERLRQRLQVLTAMLQLGVVEEALARTATFTVERQQFGQPLARFQAVSQRAADGYIDIEALRACAESALWRLQEGLDATLEAATALWWAAEAGHRVGHTVQHLHGGIGADVDYPIHRYFLWAKQLEFSQGGAVHTAAAMGEQLARQQAIGGRK
ncbi:acyl-CoA dehydrogenase family protein [Parahaliea aestuarii]|uniref:Acyl-CoA dehydrogenase n=1 Tax=Parahaliea aestuarii TaxID=1852021 RepID=A0A5C9A0G9_9GAMM|nr:acyl-CoA dehydrogenase family protein [Parahaliea aestuarii]TXS93559.1 acyl-CoA dehydrogenase [Parahaliea aestuarii]